MRCKPVFSAVITMFFVFGCQSESSDTSESLTGSSSYSWEIETNVFGTPETTFTLDGVDEGAGLYLIDVQASYPDVDWDTLDRLYIPAGNYSMIRLGNLPERSEDDPLVISNSGGQVRIGGYDHYYLFSVSGGSNWILTGRYDPDSETGDVNFPGHRGGHFANSQDTYGIVIDDDYMRAGNSGLSISDATDFEVEYIEVKEVGFAGFTFKTDDDGDTHMYNVSIHDNYIHDTGSEGMYLGSTQTQPQHQLVDWHIYNNRVLRTGTEAIQLSQLAGENRVHHNVFGPAAIDWRAAFQAYQDNNFQIGIREGELSVYNNVFIGAAQSISMFARPVDGDATSENTGVFFNNNYFEGNRNFAGYIGADSNEGMTYRFENNYFGGYRYTYNEVYTDRTAYDHFFRTFNSDTPIEFIGNTWFGPENLSNQVSQNGTSDNVMAEDNVNEEPDSIYFIDTGLDDDFDYLNLEMWTDVASLGDDQPVEYNQGMVVTYLGEPYLCSSDPCEAGLVPPDNPDVWQQLEAFADDFRTIPGGIWEEYGPLSNAKNL